MTDGAPKVRPISEDGLALQTAPPRPGLFLVIMAIGALLGWGLTALASATPTVVIDDLATERALSADTDEAATVTWLSATDVPEFPSGYDYAGTTNPVELNDTYYLVVRFLNHWTGLTRSELWSSADGLSWNSDLIELGESVSILEVAATGDGLILSGIGTDGFTMWRSVPGHVVDGSSWLPIEVDVPDGIDIDDHAIEVNDMGEVAAVVIGEIPIWRDVIAPLVPEGVDAYDPHLELSGDSVSISDGGYAVQLFQEAPEVLTTGDSVWVRLTTVEGEELMSSYNVPTGSHPIETAPDLRHIRVILAWSSVDGVDFLPVLDRNQLPNGYFTPRAANHGFIAASYELKDGYAAFESVRLWETRSGRAWEPVRSQPPSACTRFSIAVSGNRVLLTDEDGTRCLRTSEGNWEVLEEPCKLCYTVGGPAGFIGYPKGFDYATAMFSSDGANWSDVPIPTAEPYPTMIPLEDHILMFSVTQPLTGPKHMDIWVGEIR
jgi:hypothetical protein